MKTNRRNFIRSSAIITAGLLFPAKSFAKKVIDKTVNVYNSSLERVIDIINSLKNEDSSVVEKIMAGKEYKFDSYFHYPIKGGIVDEKTGSRVFFHAHRENEFGHFHTFIEDDDGELVHLVLISMDENGTPLALATVNRWVTGDKYVKAERLKELLSRFTIDPELFEDERLLTFINNIMTGYKENIYKIFDDRDEWIKNYAFTYTREPFEDYDHEILSIKEIDVFEDVKNLG
jgi:hypothetical protein